MKDREIMQKALCALEGVAVDETKEVLRQRIKELKAQEEWYSMPKEARDKIRMANMGNRNLWKPELDPKYTLAKELRAKGLMVKEACAQAGLTVDQWYRRKRIETYGADRK